MPDPLRLDRVIRATPAAVFEAWTNPEVMRRWMFVSDEGEIVRVDAVSVPGGAYSILEHNNGEDIDHYGRFLEVGPPSRLSFTLEVPKHFAENTRIDVTIEPTEEGSVLHFTQTGIDPDKTREFWRTMLDDLARLLKPNS
jgi:uncharacterized protein YndB with AHSA1/START domain